MKDINQTAVLVFSRFAEEEARRKKYSRFVSKKGSCELAAELINYTLIEARSSKLPVYTIFSDQQQGSCFGERLANAIEAVFSFGFLKVVVIGTDSPSINRDVIKNAAASLEDNQIVLGPSKDGGVYLIGLNKESFLREHFLNIPWLGSHAYEALRDYAFHFKLSLSTEALGEDIDDISTLFEWLHNFSTYALSAIFHNILTIFRIIKHGALFLFATQKNTCLNLCKRGPPRLSFTNS